MPARILVIEDNPDNLELMAYLLRAHGHEVLTAGDGRQGLEVAARERPNLVICDVQMPAIDGCEVARQLKANERLRAIPLLAVTAYAMVGDRDRILAAGFDGYLAKPINPETFVSQIENFLPLPRRYRVARLVEPAAPAAPKPPQRHTILVVDNLPVNLDFARGLLEPFGYVVVTADGLASGLQRARQQPFDLILSDVCMAEASGYDFLQAIRADPRLRSIPFVFITSTMLDDADRAKGLALGADKFLTRPIEPERLLAEIEACLAGRTSPWPPY
jgi:two-component system cell cycle response regulator